jgi:hypothetical protein
MTTDWARLECCGHDYPDLEALEAHVHIVHGDEVVGKVVQIEPQTLALLDVLAGLYEEWMTAARQRERSANAGGLFGPKMMLNAAEGQVLMDCAEQLRAVVNVFGASRDEVAGGGRGREVVGSEAERALPQVEDRAETEAVVRGLPQQPGEEMQRS